MRNFKQNTKGQFVVIAALLIAVLTLSLVAAITQVSLNNQEIPTQPVSELLLGTTSDMQRALTTALAQYTYAHYTGQSVQGAFDTMANWKKALLTSYSGLNLQINDNFKPDFNSTRWQLSDGRSAATIEYSIDIDAYGFHGWSGIASKYVNLHIYPDTIDISKPGYTSLIFQLNQSVTNGQQTEPIPNLTPDLIIAGTYSTQQSVIPATEVKLSYLGNGNYTVTFNEETNNSTKGVSLTLQTPDEGIWVSAYYYQEIALLFNTAEKNGVTTNLGTIQYLNVNFTDTAFDKNYPATPSLHNEKYFLRYYPAEGYQFAGWITNSTQNVQFINASAEVTAVTVLGIGSITALYETGTTPPQPPTATTVSIILDSLNWNGSASHQGTITFNGQAYTTLPKTLATATANYQITFAPPNSNTHFLYWQFSGDIVSLSQQSETMDIMIYGNCSATAYYMVTTTNIPINPPYDGEWNSLFFDSHPIKGSLVPYYLWSQMNSHDVTHSSSGNLKQVSMMTSPIPVPKIVMADYVNMTIYMRPTPPSSVKSLEMVVGFIYNGTNYKITSCTFYPTSTQLVYTAQMDVRSVDLGFGKQVIPQGATITITNTVTFYQDNGFNFIYNGADTPSRLDLY